ncbi:glucodextranase DOMON-like domain-containing protein [Halosimplex amylolyticum]|uniref:glucodextranase DOMON-like domain-containing protein n=1 Tax=Halosimplex amylolyticum TaxID=3396616 RepID=UPI003F5710E5
MKRRQYLAGLAGIGAVAGVSGVDGYETDVEPMAFSAPAGADSHHPGPPRICAVGTKFVDPIFVDASHGMDRDNLAPRIRGTLERDPANYSGTDFSWSVASKPAESSAEIRYAAEPWENSGGDDPYEVEPGEDGIQRYDPGSHNVAEFVPDVPGTYVLALDAPDGTHEQTIRAFPEPPSDAGGPPRIELDASYDGAADEFVVESNPALAPNSNASSDDLIVEFLADDRDALSTGDISVEGTTARIPGSAVGDETARLHAAAFDGEVHSVTDTITLDGANGAVDYPNRPPAWIEDGVMYEIFTRSFEGSRGGTTFQFVRDKVSYLSELGVDVVWLTPVVPAESSNWKPNNGYEYVGGGPHGYDALSYFHVAPDLSTEGTREAAMQEYEAFVDECHDQGIKVCFDFVINHGGRHHPLFQDTIETTSDTEPSGWTYDAVDEWNTDSKYFDWFDRRAGPITDSDGNVVDAAPAATGFWGLRVMPQWDFGNLAWREHVLAAAAFWAEVGVDAFRCDIAWGVPHSLWKEVREVVRSYDSEFMLLDEAIPNDPSFAENEFDMHFDTADFMNTAHAAAKGDVNGQALYDAVAKRKKEGWPDYSLLVNSTENHDEQRCLKLAKQGSRSNPEKAQRAAWAAGVTLPGVPFVYYGQERQITNYGENRHRGASDPRDGDISADGYKRAFMNWDDYPADHLQFYRDALALYHQNDVLKPDADLTTAWFRSDDDVLVFGRDASETDRDSVSGPEKAVVIVNFQDGPATVDLRPAVSSTDLFTGADVATSTGEVMTVEVDELAVLETPRLFSVGERIASFDDPAGDDDGPGSYTYPTADAFLDGAFDFTGVEVRETASTYQFRATVDGPLTNPWDLPGGFSVQHFQYYLRDPEASGGTTTAREGVGADLELPYQYRVVADGENGVRVEAADGSRLVSGTLTTNEADDAVVAEFPKTALDGDLSSMLVAPLLLGYDGYGPGGVRTVGSEAGEYQFGGAPGDGTGTNVIDAILPENASQSDALAAGDGGATVPYTSIGSGLVSGEEIARWSDEIGDDVGPGSYTYPTADAFYDGAFDLDEFAVYDDGDRYRFLAQLSTPVENPWNLPDGFSHQFFQVYLRDPEASGGSTTARAGVNVEFAEPYHYRVVVNGQHDKRVETPDADEPVTEDVTVSVVPSLNAVTFAAPKDAFDGTIERMDLAPLIVPFDGYGEGNVRAVQPEAGEYAVGGGTDGDDPAVMDLITPDGVTQHEALAGEDGANVPYLAFRSGVLGDRLLSRDDEVGDDDGPGSYTYPTNESFNDGAFDIDTFAVHETDDSYQFAYQIAGDLRVLDDWGPTYDFTFQTLQVYLRDPTASDGTSAAREGVNATFEAPYQYRVVAEPFQSPRIEDATGGTVSDDVGISVHSPSRTIAVEVPKDAVGDVSTLEAAPLLFGFDGYGPGRIRPVTDEGGKWQFGGGRDDDQNPNVVDMVTPVDVTQSDALDYSADRQAEIPFASLTRATAAQRIADVWTLFEDVPSAGFGKNERGMRNSVGNQLDTVERHLDGGRYEPAHNVLSSVRKKLAKHLDADYPRHTPDEPTKDDLLGAVDDALGLIDSL